MLYPIGLSMIVVGIALSAAATAEITNVPICQDYCPKENLASIAAVIDYFHYWGIAGLCLAFLGFVVVIAKSFASTRLRTFSILIGPLAASASELVTLKQTLYTSAGTLLSITEKSGFPFAYRVTDCIQAPLSYCPRGVYTRLDWFPFTYDVFFFMALGYAAALVYSKARQAYSQSIREGAMNAGQ